MKYLKHLAIVSIAILLLTNFQIFAQRNLTYDPTSVNAFAGDATGAYVNGTGLAARFNQPSNMVFDKVSGCIYICDRGNNRIRKMTLAGVVTNYAGAGTAGYVDGSASVARFDQPYGIAVDKNGNLYVSEAGMRIRKISTAGQVTTLAGGTVTGYLNATGKNALFNGLLGLAVDTLGNVYGADRYNFRIRKITPAGVVTTFAGSGSNTSYDGTGTASGFGSAHDITIDRNGNLYVLEYYAPIRQITPGAVVTSITLTSPETKPDGSGQDKYGFGAGITQDSSLNLYLTVLGDDNTSFIRKVTPLKVASRLAGGTLGDADGIGLAAHFSNLNGIVRDLNGNLYVVDGNRIRKASVPKLIPFVAYRSLSGFGGSANQVFRASGNNLTGSVTITAPDGFEVSLAPQTGFARSLTLPATTHELPSTTVYVRISSSASETMYNANVSLSSAGADTKYLPVTGRKYGGWVQIDPVFVTTVAGSVVGFADDTVSAARFNNPKGLDVDIDGNIIVADQGNNRIRKVTPSGSVTTLAGDGTAGLVNGPGSTSRFNQPAGILTDALNNTYVADNLNGVIRKITTGNVSTFAGSSKGYANGVGSAAKFNGPQDIGMDTLGNLFVADAGNKLIRKMTLNASVTTLAGNGVTGLVNDTGIRASFARPFGVSADGQGNVFVADMDNNSIRKITPQGVVTSIGQGSFNKPNGVAADLIGYIYVAETGRNMIRRISPAGIIMDFAGNGVNGADDGFRYDARFRQPRGITLNNDGSLYVSDAGNNRIRRLAKPVLKPFTTTAGTASAPQYVSISATNIYNNVRVTAPAGFEVSNGGANFGDDIYVLPSYGNELNGQNIFVRLKASAAPGKYSGNVVVSGIDLPTVTLPVQGTVTGSALSLAGDINKQMTVFPNPSKGSFNIQLSNVQAQGSRLTITDAAGKIMVDKKVDISPKASSIPVTIPGNAKGVYFIQVTSKNGKYESKVIVE